MKNKLVMQFLVPLAHMLFFTAAMSALLWITVNYSSLNAVPIAAGVCAVLYTFIAMAALVNVFRGNKLFSGSTAGVLSVSTQKRIRTAGVLIALPALLYCAIFAFTVKSFAFADCTLATESFERFEVALFGKSKIWDYIEQEYGLTRAVPVEEVSKQPAKPTLTAQKDVDFGPYMADLSRSIKRSWFPPKCSESKRVQVVFKVHSGGVISDLRLVTSSSVALADQAALRAVENAAPFAALPEGAPPDVDILFTFDYNVFGNTAKLKDASSSVAETGDSFASSAAGYDTFSSGTNYSFGDAFVSVPADNVKPLE